jgi:hypothetical protein
VILASLGKTQKSFRFNLGFPLDDLKLKVVQFKSVKGLEAKYDNMQKASPRIKESYLQHSQHPIVEELINFDFLTQSQHENLI